MQKCEVIFFASPRGRDFLKTCVILWYKKTLILSIDPQRSLGGGKEMEVEAINRAGAKVGQKVVLSFDTSPLLKATFMLYVFPIIAMVVGAFIGQKMATFLNFDASMLSAIMGFSFFGLTILFVKSRGNKLAKKEEYQPKIIRIIKQS